MVEKAKCVCRHLCEDIEARRRTWPFLFVESYVSLKWPNETDTYVFAHIGLNIPVLVRSPKSSRAKSGQYLGGRPPGNTGW